MNRVLLLGAGASADAGAPIMGEFKDAARRVLSRAKTGTTSDPAEGILQYVMDRWDELGDINVERFYVALDVLERVRDGAIEGGKADAVRYMIARTLYESISQKLGSGPYQAYGDLFDALSEHQTPEDKTALVTLNWDPLLEREADRAGKPYRLGYDRVYRHQSNEAVERYQNDIKILKLHGSMTWWFCRRCRRLYEREPGAHEMAPWLTHFPSRCPNDDCPVDGGRQALGAAMIPPTGQKFDGSGPYHRLFGSIWRQTESVIQDADELIIAGYSFPPTDEQFRLFLWQCLQSSRIQRIMIVNRGLRETETLAEYNENIGPILSKTQVHLFDEGFSAWASKVADDGFSAMWPQR